MTVRLLNLLRPLHSVPARSLVRDAGVLNSCFRVVPGARILSRHCSSQTPTGAGEAEAEASPAPPFIPSTETVTGTEEQRSFQAETQQLLDIVAKSLYTDKEVFIRELVSNASDALEKRRYEGLKEGRSTDDELNIKIATDEEKRTFTIMDSGIGMSREEMVTNLGTIAKSGSKAFMQQLQETGEADGNASNIIGQFGVGFYSVFMVADKVQVYSRNEDGSGCCWTSEGGGSYNIVDADGVAQGTKIILHLKESESSFANSWTVERILKKYSNFVGAPIVLNGNELSTVEAIWTKGKSEVTEEQHLEFYKFIAQAWDEPRMRLHYITDAPLSIKALFYIPQTHMEKWGSARMEPGVSLYCRKVLIQSKSDKILPEWLRFIKGVVDCEDLSLNISRETMQDSAMVRKLKSTLTKRVVKALEDEAKKQPEAYSSFYSEFGHFLKEGVCTDWDSKDLIAKLLRYPTSSDDEKPSSFDDYIGRMLPEQEGQIFYLNAPSRMSAQNSPYYEAFQKKGWEVLFLHHPIDDFVMQNLNEYSGKKLINAEQANLKLGDDTPAEMSELTDYIKDVLGEGKVSEVKISSRLVNSAASLYDHDSAALRHMMKMVDHASGAALPPQKMEVNPEHTVIKQLLSAKEQQEEITAAVVHQLYDNALMTAGLLDEPRAMLPNINKLLEHAVSAAAAAGAGPTQSE